MEKIYTSTRNKALARTPKEAVVKGIAEDGGLFVYDALDTLRLPLQDMKMCIRDRFTEEIRYNQGYHRVNPLMIGGNAYLKNSSKIHIVHILFTHL